MSDASSVAQKIARLSAWIDAGFDDSGISSSDQWTDHRIMKVAEESGEVITAIHNMRGGNPRKGVCATLDDVIGELLDTAAAALCAVEHLNGNDGDSLRLLDRQLDATMRRVRLVP